MNLHDLSREDLEFVAGWLLAGNSLYKKGSIGATNAYIEWPDDHWEWIAVDHVFETAEYHTSAIGAILLLKGIHYDYDKIMRGLDEVEAGHG